MAITFLKRKKIQKYLILVFVIIILIAALVAWYGFFKKPKEPTLPPIIRKLPEKIEINFEVLKNPFLREAQPFEKIQPFEKTRPPEEEIGRENPFTPY